ncbi:MAG: DUF4126 domain-containing protein [bacterium]|nr:DUF4126 domain-containing protein [bacterium]
MQTLQLLSTALGLSALAGINLYLTVFALSLSLNLDWIALSPEMQQLEILGHPVILLVSGFLYFVEFFADKVPWVDSMWDAVHTAVRPLGAAFLAITVLGEADPTLEVLAALLCGGVALAAHTTKAGARLAINTSPEPVSNIAVSVGEDVVVIGGLVLIYQHPIISAVLVLLFLALFIYLAPKLARHIIATIRFVFFKLFSFGSKEEEEAELGRSLPLKARNQLGRADRLVWAVPITTGMVPSVPRNKSAHLVLVEQPDRIGVLVGGKSTTWLPVKNLEVHDSKGVLFDEISFFTSETDRGFDVRFYKHQRNIIEAIKKDLFRRSQETGENQMPEVGLPL